MTDTELVIETDDGEKYIGNLRSFTTSVEVGPYGHTKESVTVEAEVGELFQVE